MNELIKLFIKIFKDERGFDPVTLALIAGGTQLAGQAISAFGKPKKTTIDPFADFRQTTAKQFESRLGQRTPFTLNPAFIQQQPGIEAAAEKNILGKLQTPITAEGITSDITNRAFNAQRARQAELFEEEKESTANRFNRLGLVSSTPGLTAQSDIDEKQRISAELLSSDLAVQQIQSQLQALGLQEQFAFNTQGQALGLGQTQRGAQVQAQSFSLQDIERQIQEELGFGQLASNFLTAQPAETFFEQGTQQKIGGAISGAGQAGVNALLLQQLLGSGGGGGKTQSQILGFDTRRFS